MGPRIRVRRKWTGPSRNTSGGRRHRSGVSADAAAGTVDWQLDIPGWRRRASRNHASPRRRAELPFIASCCTRPRSRSSKLRAHSRHSAVTLAVRARHAEVTDGRLMMAEPLALEDLARQALDGDRDALDHLVRDLQNDVYGLALRMLWNREDAEDATQEILVRAVTRLAQFDFRSKLKTWVYRIAVNYMLDVKKSPVERMHLNFKRSRRTSPMALSSDGPAEAERSLLIEEVKIGCTLAMLQCLDRPHRLAYVLGEILELPAPKPPKPWTSLPNSFASTLVRPGRRSKRLHAPTVVSPPTAPLCLPSTCSRRTSPGPCSSRCARLRRGTVVIPGGPRAHSPLRAGAMGPSTPSRQ